MALFLVRFTGPHSHCQSRTPPLHRCHQTRTLQDHFHRSLPHRQPGCYVSLLERSNWCMSMHQCIAGLPGHRSTFLSYSLSDSHRTQAEAVQLEQAVGPSSRSKSHHCRKPASHARQVLDYLGLAPKHAATRLPDNWHETHVSSEHLV